MNVPSKLTQVVFPRNPNINQNFFKSYLRSQVLICSFTGHFSISNVANALVSGFRQIPDVILAHVIIDWFCFPRLVPENNEKNKSNKKCKATIKVKFKNLWITFFLIILLIFKIMFDEVSLGQFKMSSHYFTNL